MKKERICLLSKAIKYFIVGQSPWYRLLIFVNFSSESGNSEIFEPNTNTIKGLITESKKAGWRGVGSGFPSLHHTFAFLQPFNTGRAIPSRQCPIRRAPWTPGRQVETLFNSQRLVNVSFLGRGGVRGECQEGKWITTRNLHQSYPWPLSTKRGR